MCLHARDNACMPVHVCMHQYVCAQACVCVCAHLCGVACTCVSTCRRCVDCERRRRVLLKAGLSCLGAATLAEAGRRCHKTAPKNTFGTGGTLVELRRAWHIPGCGEVPWQDLGGRCTSCRALQPCQHGGHEGGHCGKWDAARAEGVPCSRRGLAGAGPSSWTSP